MSKSVEKRVQPHKLKMPPHINKAYLVYRNMGSNRTLARAAELTGGNKDVVRRWSSMYGWGKRIKEEVELDDSMLSQSLTDTYLEIFDEVKQKEQTILDMLGDLIDQAKSDVDNKTLKINNPTDLRKLLDIYHIFVERSLARTRPGIGSGFEEILSGYSKDFTVKDRLQQTLIQLSVFIADSIRQFKEATSPEDRDRIQKRILDLQDRVLKHTRDLEAIQNRGGLPGSGEDYESLSEEELEERLKAYKDGDPESVRDIESVSLPENE